MPTPNAKHVPGTISMLFVCSVLHTGYALQAVGLTNSSLVAKVTPVEKVITLLGKLQEQITEEGKAEAIEYDRYACFCKEQGSFKQYAIEKSDEKIAVLTAAIDALESEISDLNGEISALGVRIDEISELHSAETISSSAAHSTYLGNADNLTFAITATEKAIAALKASKDQLQGGAKLDLLELDTVAKSLSFKLPQLASLVAKLAQSPASYTYNSNEIISVLQDLLITFKEAKKDLDTSEIDRQAASDKKLLGLANEKKFKTQSKTEKEALVGSKTETKHEKEGSRAGETAARDADKNFQMELVSQCEARATEFDQRSQARASELTAMSEAIEALKTGVAPKYGANKKLVGIQRYSSIHKVLLPISFVQAVAVHEHAFGTATKRAIQHLDAEAERLHSPTLAALATKAVVQEDHFVKVRGLIKDLITTLEAEAASEATSKSFCDTEMKAAVSTRDARMLDMERESTTISQKEAEKAQLLEEIATLGQEIADLNKALSEAAQLRSEEKANNEKTIADAGEGKESIKFAISVLQQYYGFVQSNKISVGAAPAPASYTPYVAPNADREGQTVADRAPEMSYSGDYRGKQEASTGILGILQVILSDFERTESTVTDEETAAASDHAQFEKDTQSSIDTKGAEKTQKENAVVAAGDAITAAKDALKDATELHTSSLNELEKLQAMCVEGEESWAERKAKREKEIEALKEALKILEEWKS